MNVTCYAYSLSIAYSFIRENILLPCFIQKKCGLILEKIQTF